MFNALFYTFITPTRIRGWLLLEVGSGEIARTMSELPGAGLMVAVAPVVPNLDVIYPGVLVFVEVV